MAGKKKTPAPPVWYSPQAYLAADELDTGDWLLNLALRGWLHREPQARTEDALRHVGPVLRRGDDAQIARMHNADVHRWVDSFKPGEWDDAWEAIDEAVERPSLPSDVWNALRSGRVGSGVESLGLSALYVFEQKLPERVRAEGRRMQRRVRSGDGLLESLHAGGFPLQGVPFLLLFQRG